MSDLGIVFFSASAQCGLSARRWARTQNANLLNLILKGPLA